MSRGIFALMVAFFSAVSPTLAQVPFFQSYYPLKRNQQLQVNSLLQDKKGFVWIGTDRGLFRFDGTNYRHFAAADSSFDDGVTALAEDPSGKIWIGHESGELSFVENGTLTSFLPREGSAVEPVSDILFDKRGTMWFSTRNDGIYYFQNGRLFRIDEQEGLPDLFIYDLFEDNDGNIWAGTDAGVAICSLQDNSVAIRVIDSDDGLPDVIIKKIRHASGDSIALATEDAGILLYNMGTGAISSIISEFGGIADFVIKGDEFWIATPREGLIIYDSHIGRSQHIHKLDGASLLSVSTLLLDREGSIWCGSKSGLLRTSGSAVEHISDVASAGSDNVMALTVDNRQRLWFSTNKGLYKRHKAADGSVKMTELLGSTGYRDVPVISLHTDDRGYVWAGLYGRGLLRIDPESHIIRHFEKELRNGNILGITGSGNTLWVATLGGASSLTYDNGDYSVRNYSTSDGLSSDFIYQVFVDSRDRVWFATDGKGASMLDGDGFHNYREGLASGVVYNFTEDIDGGIWVTSQDNGVYRFESDRFVAVPDLRLRDNSVQALASDPQGNVIALHNYGIDAYNVKDGRMRHWGEDSGLRDKQPNLNAVAYDKFGQMFFGTTGGIVKFSLRNEHAYAIPNVSIDGISIFGEPVDSGSLARLKHNDNNITIGYLGFWYQNTEDLNYVYRLQNYDVEWIGTRNQEVTYSKLPAGDYTFQVKVSDSEDFTNAAEASISFSIRPPFWTTGTFYVIVAALFIIGAYGLMKVRERSLLKDKLLLEAKVEERTREIQQKTEEIQAQNEEIMAQAEEIQGINENLEMLVKQRTAELEKKNKALEEYAFINAHKLRSPVASILGLVNLLAKDETRADSPVVEHLKQSADRLDAIVRSITKAIEKADNKL